MGMVAVGALVAVPIISILQKLNDTSVLGLSLSHVVVLASLGIFGFYAYTRRENSSLRLNPALIIFGVYCAAVSPLIAYMSHGATASSYDYTAGIIYAAKVGFCLVSYHFGQVYFSQSRTGLRDCQFAQIIVLCVCFVLINSAPAVSLNARPSIGGGDSIEYLAIFGAIAASSSMFFTRKTSSYLMYVVGVAMCLGLALLTFRRSSLLAVLAVFLIGLLVGRSSSRRVQLLNLILLAALLSVVVATFVLLDSGGSDILSRKLSDLDVEHGGTGSGRLIFWSIAFESWWSSTVDEKLFGFGPGFIREILRYRIGLAIGAHNDFLDVLLSYGLVGIVLMAVSLFSFIHAIMGSRIAGNNYYALGVTSLVGLMVISLSTGGMFDPVMFPAFFLMGGAVITRGPGLGVSHVA